MFNTLTLKAHALWQRCMATPDSQNRSMFLLLGLIGWGLIVLAYPFDWELPAYANY